VHRGHRQTDTPTGPARAAALAPTARKHRVPALSAMNPPTAIPAPRAHPEPTPQNCAARDWLGRTLPAGSVPAMPARRPDRSEALPLRARPEIALPPSSNPARRAPPTMRRSPAALAPMSYHRPAKSKSSHAVNRRLHYARSVQTHRVASYISNLPHRPSSRCRRNAPAADTDTAERDAALPPCVGSCMSNRAEQSGAPSPCVTTVPNRNSATDAAVVPAAFMAGFPRRRCDGGIPPQASMFAGMPQPLPMG